MSFAADVKRFVFRTQRLTRDVYVGTATRVHASIKGDASGQPDPVTGAPGQPVDTGNLKSSWILAIGPDQSVISTNVVYAPGIEDGIAASGGRIVFKSKVGGKHSVKLTIAGASALQADEVRRLA
jgi:hypothetical protein